MRISDLVELDRDHPGFRDPVYRARRNDIARLAHEHRSGQPVPDAPYTEEEHAVWRAVWSVLGELHQRYVSAELVALQGALGLDRQRIPQLRELNPRLQRAAGYRMEPVPGLVDARSFLASLGGKVFLSTQYVRHHSKPFYTPEPDVIHELVGHAASLMHPGIAAVSAAMGAAAVSCSESELSRLARVYWYTVEFGVAWEGGALKAVGAGLLSSCGELERVAAGPPLRPFVLDDMAATPYDSTQMQPWYYAAPSTQAMLEGVVAWVEAGAWRDEVAGVEALAPAALC